MTSFEPLLVLCTAPDEATGARLARGLIEARGFGILRLPAAGPTALSLVVDLDRETAERLPPRRTTGLAGRALPLVAYAPHPHFPAAILLYLKGASLT